MKEKKKQAQRLYRHYVDGSGRFMTEKYRILQLMLVPLAYKIEQDGVPGSERDVPAAWIGRPRAAELWTRDPDPEKAYAALLGSARKDLDDARGRLAMYERLYEKLSAAERRPCI